MTHTAPKVVLSYGMGVDSTAILLRWAFEPETRPCDWEDILVVTAMTGNEWEQTGDLVTQHILPLLEMEGVRYAQIARRGNSSKWGYNVLSDTSVSKQLFLGGDFTLADEMLLAGSVPQSAGPRKCSIKSKGEPLDAFIWDQVGAQQFIHVMGFEANEQGRAVRDAEEGRKGLVKAKRDPDQRIPSYPLLEWGWDRQSCLDYIESVLGVKWRKSACTFCPFALNKGGREEALAAFAANPSESLLALRMEYTSQALNDNQSLTPSFALSEAIDQDSWDTFAEWLEDQEHAVYRIRRVILPKKDDPTKKGCVARSVEVVATGSREQMFWELNKIAHNHGQRIEKSGRDEVISRVWLARRDNTDVTSVDHLFVVAPAGVVEKQRENFETWWSERVA